MQADKGSATRTCGSCWNGVVWPLAVLVFGSDACGGDKETELEQTGLAVARRSESSSDARDRRKEVGGPLARLSQDELARFEAGREIFAEEEDIADGLGPVFNDTGCAVCHGEPVIGGGSERVETRFGRSENGVFDALVDRGGSLMQEQGIGVIQADGRTCDFRGEVVPKEANVRAGRLTTPLFGLGLVDAVPDEVFSALAQRQARETPETAGRVHLVQNLVTGGLSVGKFGWKAQVPSLEQFSADAYLNEMGITSPLFPQENCPNGDCSLLACDPVPDVEDDGADVVAFADFMSLLAPVKPISWERGDDRRGRFSSDYGKALFGRLGCADCHAPSLRSGSSPVAALANVTFAPYSDFLLHRMGALGDGIVQGDAKPDEMRTAPLWGLRLRKRFLHDGRAMSIEAAILAHDGQGRRSRDRFKDLSRERKRQVLGFLGQL